ncbi:unnamed protein product [Camellia sinensis]
MNTTKNMKSPFRGIINDFKGRKACYKQDWHDAFCSGTSLSAVDTLASTAICGIIHSIFGNQPLLILGVAEPTVIMYTYLYNFTKEKADLGQELFLAWAGWVCVWTTIFLLLLTVFNAYTIISRFTRIAGELLGTLIAVLFMQEAIKQRSNDMEVRHRLWGSLYGSNMVTNVIWCTYQNSFRSSQEALWSTSLGVYAFAPLDGNQVDMGKVPVVFIFAAFIPAMMIAGLCFFDHCVASQMAQQKEFNLKNPSAYHYDILLLGIMAILFIEAITQTLLCGLIGLPPVNGVLPQSPMHTKSLAVLKRQLIRKKMVKSAKGCIKQQGSNSEIYGRMQAIFVEMDTTLDVRKIIAKKLKKLKDAVMKSEHGGSKDGNDLEKHIDVHMPVRVYEQRVSNLLQSLLVRASLLAMPAIKMIPTSVLRGYFAYMDLDSLPRNQFGERILLLFITPKRRYKVLEGDHASFVDISFPNCFTHSIFRRWMQLSMRKLPDGDKPLTGNENHEFESSDAEILDELMTNRGGLNFR